MSSQAKTKLCIIIDSKTPIILRVPVSAHHLTLGQFKRLTSLHGEHYKYYFKSHDNEFGVVKEEILDDDSPLPCDRDRIVAWVVTDETNQTSLFEPENPYGRLENHRPLPPGPPSMIPSINTRSPQPRSINDSKNPASAIYIDVQIVLDNFNFLGLTLVGHVDEYNQERKGIYVQGIAPGSAADLDGSIKVGDRIVEVNGISLKNSNPDDAAAIFKSCVDQRGPIHIVLRRPVQTLGRPRTGYGDALHNDQTSLIDATRHPNQLSGSPFPTNEIPTPLIRPVKPVPTTRHQALVKSEPLYSLPRSMTPRSLYTSSNYDSWVPSSDLRLPLDSRSVHGTSQSSSLRKINTTLHCAKDDIYTIYSAIKRDAKSLDIKDREWLKVIVKDAFLGSTLIKWLSRNVYGFTNRSEIKIYANRMLSLGLIRGPIANSNFSGKCYYNLS